MTTVLFQSLARIRNSRDGVCGAGCLIGDRHVMTCAHVVDEALGRPSGSIEPPAEEVVLDLPFIGARGLRAPVVAWCPTRSLRELEEEPASDIAVLELAEGAGDGIRNSQARLAAVPPGTGFMTFGYPKGYDNGVEASGELLASDSGGWRHLRDTQDRGYFVEPGFSGAPLFDPRDRRLLGMVVAADTDPGRRLAFAMPTETLCRAWPPLAKPYKELFAFEEEDAGLFFGREQVIDELSAKLEKAPFLTVIGPSGAGKSSLVMAGLVPRLRKQGDWLVARARPGRRPLYNLAYALSDLMSGAPAERMDRADDLEARLVADPERLVERAEAILRALSGSRRILLVIDQLEELVTHRDASGGDDGRATDRTAVFLKALAAVGRQPMHSAPSIQIVATMRADFTGWALQHRELAELLRDADIKLGTMAPAELAAAIERPAARFGVTLEEGLAAEIVSATSGSPGGLPLMQFALNRLWERQRNRCMTWEAYRSVSGIEGALSDHADAVYRALDKAAQGRARRVLLRLVRLAVPGGQIEDTRAVARREEIGEADWPIVQRLADERLLVVGQDPGGGSETAELAHEALIRSWPRFRRWLDEDREFGLWRQRLRGDIEKWDGKHEDALLRGALLAEAENWRRSREEALNNTERAFIEASTERARREKEARKAAERERRDLLEERARILEETSASQRRSLRHLRLALAAFAVAIVAAGFFAYEQYTLAERERVLVREAEELAAAAAREARAARSAELAARARALFERMPGGNTTAALLALESLRLGGGAEAQGLLVEILALTPRGVRDLPGIPPYTEARESPDGTMVVAWRHEGHSGSDPGAGTAVVIDPASGAVKARIAQQGWVRPAISPGGRWLAVGGYGRRFQVMDLTSGEVVLDEPRDGLTAAAFSPDATRLYVADGGGSIEVRAAPEWGLLSSSGFREGEWNNNGLGIELSPDGSKLLVHYPGGAFLGPPGGSLEPVPDLRPFVRHAGFDPTGTRILTISRRSRAEIRDAATGTIITGIPKSSDIQAHAFSPDGSRLAIGDKYGIVEVWDVAAGRRHLEMDHDREAVTVLRFNSDGSRLVSAYSSGAIRSFDAESGELLQEHVRPTAIDSATFGDDAFYAGDTEGAIHRFDLETGADTEIFRPSTPAEGGVWPLLIEPRSGRLVGGVGESDSSRSWTDLWAIDSQMGQEIWRVAHNGELFEVTFSPDGTRLATATVGDRDANLTIRDAMTGERLHEPDVPVFNGGLAFGGDGRLVVARGEDTRVVDLETGARLYTIGEPGGVDGMKVLPDGRTVVTYGDDVIRAWDAVSGEEIWRRSAPELGYGVPFSGDGTRYARRAKDGRSILVHDTRRGDEIARIPVSGPRPPAFVTLSPSGDRALLSYSPQPDPKSGEPILRVELWSVASEERLQELRGKPTFVYAEFGPGDYIRTFIPGDRLVLLDAATGALLWEEPHGTGWISSPPSLPRVLDAPLMISTSGRTLLRDPLSGREIGRLDVAIGGASDLNATGSRLVASLVHGEGEAGPQLGMIDMETGAALWTADVSELHEGAIKGIRFSSDQRRVLVALHGSTDSSVFLKVLDATNGRIVSSLGSESRVSEFAPLADADLIATHDLAGTVRVWRLSTGEEMHRVAHGFSASGTSVARDAPLALTWKEGSLRLWNLRDGSELAHRTTEGHVQGAALDPAGRLVAYYVQRPQRTGAGDPFDAILLWDRRSGGPSRRIALEGAPRFLEFDATGARLSARIGEGTIRIWDTASLRPVATLSSTAGAKFSTLQGFSGDGAYFVASEIAAASGVNTSQIRAWRLSEKGGAREVARLDDHWRINLPGNGRLVSVGEHTGGRVWDLASGDRETLDFPDARFCCHGSTGVDRRVLYKDYDAVKALDVVTGEIVEARRDPASDSLSAASFSADLSRAFTAERDSRDGQRVPGAVRLTSLADGHEIARIRPDATISSVLPIDREEAALLLGTPGGTIVGGSYERAFLWQPAEEKLLHLNGDNPINAADVSPDDRYVVLGEGVWEEDGDRQVARGEPRLSIHDASTGERLHTLAFETPVSGAAFSGDGKLLVARDRDAFVLYQVDGWRELKRREMSFAFLGGPIGFLGNEWIVVLESHDWSQRVRLVSVNSEEDIVLPGSSIFGSGDDWIFATLDRQFVRVWQLDPRSPSSVTLLAKFEAPKQNRRPLFAGPGNKLFIGGENSLRRLLYKPDAIQAEVCRRMGRGLTEDEVAEFFPTDPPADPCAGG